MRQPKIATKNTTYGLPMSGLAAFATANAKEINAKSHASGLTIKLDYDSSHSRAELTRPGIYVILQGNKILSVADRVYNFPTGSYGVVSISLPSLTTVFTPHNNLPYVRIKINIDTSIVQELIPSLTNNPVSNNAVSIETLSLYNTNIIGRYLKTLAHRSQQSVSYKLIERELLFSLLQGPLGGVLAQMGRHNSRLAQMRASVDLMAATMDKPLKLGEIANEIGLTASTLPIHFKSLTGFTPIAYRKYLRLFEARRILLQNSNSCISAASEVGYCSTSHFSRDYKKIFGNPPFKDLKRLRNIFNTNTI